METVIAILLLVITILLISRKRDKKKLEIIAPTTNLDTRSNRIKAREKRLKRHRRIWSVLRFMVVYNELMDSKNFYELKNKITTYNEAFGRMRKEHVNSSDIETAIRFCLMENFYGVCQYTLNPQEIEQIQNWQNIQINEEDVINNALLSYQQHWDNVLNSYKRLSAKKNRLTYLIEDLEEIMTMPLLQQHPNVIKRLKELQTSYSHLLESF